MLNDLDWKQPAVIGGLIVGVFSAIPGVSALNCCFCAWALIGGAVAVSMTVNRSSRFPSSSEAAQIGLRAGGIGPRGPRSFRRRDPGWAEDPAPKPAGRG